MRSLIITKEQRQILQTLTPDELEAVENAVFVRENAKHYTTSKLVTAGNLIRSHGLGDLGWNHTE